jgi:hypothetical protein
MVNNGIWATDKKKERLSEFLKVLKANNGEEIKKVLALSELKLGVTRETALHYLEIFKDIEYIAIVKTKLVIKEVL